MRLTLVAFGIIALSLHLHARQMDPSPTRAPGGRRVAMVAGSPVVIR